MTRKAILDAVIVVNTYIGESFYEEMKNAHTQYKNASTVYFSDTVIKQAEHGLILA